MKQKTRDIGKFYYFYPQTVAFVGCANNIMPAAWHTPISAQPPLHGVLVSPKRYTFELLSTEKGFTLNFLDHGLSQVSADTGSTTGRDMNKLTSCRIKYTMGDYINGPILEQAYAAYECAHYAIHEIGDHFLFVGKIVLLHYDESCLNKISAVDPDKIKPMLYFGKDRYITIDPNSLVIKTRQ